MGFIKNFIVRQRAVRDQNRADFSSIRTKQLRRRAQKTGKMSDIRRANNRQRYHRNRYGNY